MPGEMHDRLKWARENAPIDEPYTSATDAAERHGWKVSTYLGHENGTRGFGRTRARIYADTFKVGLEWLQTGRGKPRRNATIPLGGYIGAGGHVYPIDDTGGYGLERVEAPPEGAESAVAFVVQGTSMYPAYYEGDTVYCDESQPIEECIGRECVVDLANGARALKIVVRGSRKGTFTLMSHNQAPIPDVKLNWASPVTWIKRTGRRDVHVQVHQPPPDLPVKRFNAG